MAAAVQLHRRQFRLPGRYRRPAPSRPARRPGHDWPDLRPAIGGPRWRQLRLLRHASLHTGHRHGDTRLAAAILDQAQPESRDGSAATVSGCIGIALGLLDQWLTGHDAEVPAGLARLTRLPAGHWTGEHAATDILTLARKGRAFASLDALIARQGGQHVLYGSALALAAALQAWSRHAGTPLIDLARTVIR